MLGLAFKARHRRRARLARAQAHPAARARARRRRGPRPEVATPTASFEDAVARRRRGRRRDQPHRLPRPEAARRASRALATARRARRRPVELLRRGAGLRLRGRSRRPCRSVSRVLVTGGAGTIGAAVVRRLLRDRDWEVRVSDQRPAPDWMREGCEIHQGDLRDLAAGPARRPRAARTSSTSRRSSAGSRTSTSSRYTLTEVNSALYDGVVRAAVDSRASSASSTSPRSMVFERATQFPTTEEHVWDCPSPRSAYGFSKLAGEVWCRAAHDEHGPALHDLPPVQRLRPGRDARGRARDRAHGARRHQEVPGAARRRAAADLRLRRADPDAHARRRHRRRRRDRDGPPRRR